MSKQFYYKSRKNFTAENGKRYSFADNITEVEYFTLSEADRAPFTKLLVGNKPVVYKKDPVKRVDINPYRGVPNSSPINTPFADFSTDESDGDNDG